MTALLKYDAACRAVSEAKTLDEVKDVRDKAEAVRHYARQAKNRELEIDCAEIRIRAERKLGEILCLSKSSGQLNKGGRPSLRRIGRATLRDIGITKALSSRTQRLAAIPQVTFEKTLIRWRADATGIDGRVTPGLALDPTAARSSEAGLSKFVIASGDIRRWTVGKLSRVIGQLNAIMAQCGGADDDVSIGDCVNDTKLDALLLRGRK